MSSMRAEAEAIWSAALDAARPETLLPEAFHDPKLALDELVRTAGRILVVGAGKAGASMSASLEEVLCNYLAPVEGLVNVPADTVRPLRKIQLHAARPAGSNQPTAEGVHGALKILQLLESAEPTDIAFCLLSGGGSALLPAPIEDITLADKQFLTLQLHHCGATINEMNAVRKHLSRIKGGRLAQAFRGRQIVSLILSDVVGDPLDVIASGPTAADPTTFGDALAVLQNYNLVTEESEPIQRIVTYLQRGLEGRELETLKELPSNIRNIILGNNARSLSAAQGKAEMLGYRVLNLGAFVEGETKHAATVHAGIVRSIRADQQPLAPPVCILSGGETTVTLSEALGKGGRNQEFVLAVLVHLGAQEMRDVVVLSGGTDGEDGPTDAAGAIADEGTLARAASKGLLARDHLAKHDAYRFFDAASDLMRTGLTQTNVMDVRVILVR